MKNENNLNNILVEVDQESTHDPWFQYLEKTTSDLPKPLRWIANLCLVIPGLIIIGILRAVSSKPGIVAVVVAYFLAKCLKIGGGH